MSIFLQGIFFFLFFMKLLCSLYLPKKQALLYFHQCGLQHENIGQLFFVLITNLIHRNVLVCPSNATFSITFGEACQLWAEYFSLIMFRMVRGSGLHVLRWYGGKSLILHPKNSTQIPLCWEKSLYWLFNARSIYPE